MSATRDKDQKIGFVYSNLYHLYKKGVEAAKAAPEVPQGAGFAAPASAPAARLTDAPVGLTRGKVLKSGHAETIESFRPAELLGKRVELAQKRPVYAPKPQVLRQTPAAPAIQGLKQNLEKLNDLHARLRFMLQELEDLVKE
jgi:hypothetical protein